MKKVVYAVALAALTMFAASCHFDFDDDDRREAVRERELPSASREFLRIHFGGVGVDRAVRKVDDGHVEYKVYLSNGFDVEFDRSGVWRNVDGHFTELPLSVIYMLPESILQYVDYHYPDLIIVEIDKWHGGYEVGLNSDFELDFTSDGVFIRMDN